MIVFQSDEGACLTFAYCTSIGVPSALHMWWSHPSAASRLHLHTPAQHLQQPTDPRELGVSNGMEVLKVSNGLEVLKVTCQLQTFCSGYLDSLHPCLSRAISPSMVASALHVGVWLLSGFRPAVLAAPKYSAPLLASRAIKPSLVLCPLSAAYWCLSMVRRGRCKSWPGRPLHAGRVLMRLSFNTFGCTGNVRQCLQSSCHCLRLHARVPPRHCFLSPLHSARV